MPSLAEHFREIKRRSVIKWSRVTPGSYKGVSADGLEYEINRDLRGGWDLTGPGADIPDWSPTLSIAKLRASEAIDRQLTLS